MKQSAKPFLSVNLKFTVFSFFISALLWAPLFAQEFDPNSVRSSDCRPGKYQCGYLPASKEIQDTIPLKRDFNSFDEIPSSVDLSSKMPPVGNQGQQSSCVAWATGYAIKSYLAADQGKSANYDPPFKNGGQGKNVFSPAFIYNQQNGGKDEGLYYYKTMDFLVKSGVAPWSSMPYSEKDYRTQPKDAVKKEALQYRIKSYTRLNFKKPDEIKRVLAQGNVVLIGMTIDDGFYNLKGSQVYDANSGQDYGGHAMTIVGYDDNKTSKSGKKGAFKLQNSWGTSWGDKGFGWVSYAILAKTGQESYALVDPPKTTTVDPAVTTTTVTPTLPLLPPADIKASRGEFDSKIVLTWSASQGAVSYLIQRRATNTSKYDNLAYANLPTYTDSAVSPDSAYIYRVVSYSTTESSFPSKDIEGYTSESSTTSGQLGQVVGLQAQTFLSGNSPRVSLTWSEIDGATAYSIARIENTKAWKIIGSSKSGSFTDASPVVGKANSYKVVATRSGSNAGEWSDSVAVEVANKEVAPDKIASVTVSNGEFADKIILAWAPAPGATIYYIYRFNNAREQFGPFKTTGTSFEDTDAGLKDGGYHAYTIFAGNSAGYSKQSDYVYGYVNQGTTKRAAGVTLSPPQNLTGSVSSKDNKVNLKWNAVKDTYEYYVYRKKVTADDKGKHADFKFLTQVPAKSTQFSENFPGEPGELFLYSIRSKAELGSESADSNVVSVFLNKAPSP
ncbi:C1 family peptidase, partial [Leptospira idonii]